MKISPRLRTRYGQNIGIELFVQFPDISPNEESYLEADVAAGNSSLSANGVNFAVDQYIVIGQVGAEKSEIIKLHGSTAPTSTAITLSSNTVFPHNRGDVIRFIPYNQIVVERSTDGGTNFTPLSAVDIRPDATETYIQRPSDASTDVYRLRFYNSNDGTYSGYSSNYTASGISANTRGAIKRRALNELGEDIDSIITDELLDAALDDARREIDGDQRVRRFSFRTKFNTAIGVCIPGRYSIAVPSDLRDKNTNDHILGVRIGRNNLKIEYMDFNQFQQFYREVAHTTLNGAISAGASSLVLTLSGDFDDSGSIDIAAEGVTEDIDNATYTTNTLSTNTLSGVASVANNHSTGRDVWQQATFGEPTAYTIHDGYIYFNFPFSNDLAGENIYLDYYKAMTVLTDDSTELDEPEYDMYVNFLKWIIKSRKSKGTLKPTDDSDFTLWLDKKERFIAKQFLGQSGYLIPG